MLNLAIFGALLAPAGIYVGSLDLLLLIPRGWSNVFKQDHKVAFHGGPFDWNHSQVDLPKLAVMTELYALPVVANVHRPFGAHGHATPPPARIGGFRPGRRALRFDTPTAETPRPLRAPPQSE